MYVIVYKRYNLYQNTKRGTDQVQSCQNGTVPCFKNSRIFRNIKKKK